MSEAAGVNSAAGSFGLSFGLAFAGAIMLATLSLDLHERGRREHGAAPDDKQQVADALEDDAEVMSNTQLEAQLAGEPEDVQAEIIRINTDARPLALQVALCVPILAALARAGDRRADDAPARSRAVRGGRRDGRPRVTVRPARAQNGVGMCWPPTSASASSPVPGRSGSATSRWARGS